MALSPLLLCLAACVRNTQPTIKVGLVAPFEGRYRDVGYEVLYAVRLAVREANARGGVAGHIVELTALDDGGDPAMAVEQALKLTTDPQVVAVIGHWLEATTTAAVPAYAEAGLPVLATTSGPLPSGTFRLGPSEAEMIAAAGPGAAWCTSPCGWIEGAAWLAHQRAAAPRQNAAGPPIWAFPQFAALAGAAADGAYVVTASPQPAESTDPGFAERYSALSNGVTPRTSAVLAFDAANTLFAAIEAGAATRQGVTAALAVVEHEGLSGTIRFDAAGPWLPSARLYRWRSGQLEQAFP